MKRGDESSRSQTAAPPSLPKRLPQPWKLFLFKLSGPAVKLQTPFTHDFLIYFPFVFACLHTKSASWRGNAVDNKMLMLFLSKLYEFVNEFTLCVFLIFRSVIIFNEKCYQTRQAWICHQNNWWIFILSSRRVGPCCTVMSTLSVHMNVIFSSCVCIMSSIINQ